MKYSERKTIKVTVTSERPDFRIFADFLWGNNHPYDSDGDSFNPASRNWTELYMASRKLENQWFDIYSKEEDNTTFEVTSENQEILHRIAYFLKRETKGITKQTDAELIELMGNEFNLNEALRRADISIWRSSTIDNPYPNLK